MIPDIMKGNCFISVLYSLIILCNKKISVD